MCRSYRRRRVRRKTRYRWIDPAEIRISMCISLQNNMSMIVLLGENISYPYHPRAKVSVYTENDPKRRSMTEAPY